MTSDQPAERTFADLLNGLTGTRPVRPAAAPADDAPHDPPPAPAEEPVETASAVRAYAWTGGRTRSTVRLEIETLVSTTDRAEELLASLRSEHQAVAALCRQVRSVAEVGALLALPIGVVRVLLADMSDLGLVQVHRPAAGTDERPDVELLHRVLRGLTNLPT